MDNKNLIFSKIMADDLFAPEIGGVYIQTFQSGFRMESHDHNTVEVISVIHGSSYMVINNQYIKIKKNECLIIFPNISHSFFLNYNESCRLINVHFNPGKTIEVFNMPDLQKDLRFFYELKTNEMSYLKLVDNAVIRELSNRILKEVEIKNEFSEVLLRLYFSELYIRLSQIMNENLIMLSRPLSKYIISALEFIKNFYNEKITVEEIARNAGLSVRHLSRLFSEELGNSILDYINSLRIKKAKELLESNDMDITNIALSLGFSTSQYFTTFFKKSESITPKKYKELTSGRILNKF